MSVSIPVIVNGDICSGFDARVALRASGADGVMIGRAAYGRPWLPGQVARSLRAEPEELPSLAQQLHLVDELYEQLLLHYGRDVGRRHARKHLGWALEVAAGTAGIGSEHLKPHRGRMLTAEEPGDVRRHLANTYAALAEAAASLGSPDYSRGETHRALGLAA